MALYLIIVGIVLVVVIQKAYTKIEAFFSKLEVTQEQIQRQLARIVEKMEQNQGSKATVEYKEIFKAVPKADVVSAPKVEEITVKPIVVVPPVVINETEIKKEEFVEAAPDEHQQEKVTANNPTRPFSENTSADVNSGIPALDGVINKYRRGEIDYEKYIGENLVSKIGIAILVLAIGFFVKYAIDNDWIGPVGRVCIGLLAGGILIGLAHKLRKDYAAFTSVLVGGGMAVFYFTIALAYHQFHLFNQTTAFGIMVVITIFAVALSLLYDRQELAVISMVGGYATPFMVSNGSGNYIALLSYLCILNTGILIIAYLRTWRILNVLAFIFTFVIFDSWLFTLPEIAEASTYLNGFIFASIFFLFFFIAVIANNIRENRKFLPFDFSMLLANSVQYFAVGLVMLFDMKAIEYRGLFSASMAIFHLIVSYILFRRQSADKNILYLLIGITLTFISITAPLQLDGNFITLFWASEAVLLLWLYQKSGIRIISLGSIIVWCITLVSLVVVLNDSYSMSSTAPLLNIIANKAFMSALYVGMCTTVIYYLRRKALTFEESESYFSFNFPRNAFLIVAITVFFIAGALEIGFQFDRRFDIALSGIYLILYLLIFVVGLASIIIKYELIKLSAVIKAIVYAGLIGIYMLTLPLVFDTYHELLSQHKYEPYFIAHWISALIAAGLIYNIIAQLRLAQNIEIAYTWLTWAIGTAVIVFLSAECYFVVFGVFYGGPNTEANIENVFLKACLPILWGICSFGFMWVGMRNRFRDLRVYSLVLFSVTLLKLFTYDISHVPVAGKIAAFFCLGVLLLVVSFMYQRLKKLITKDEEQAQI